jgi:hypothetical protein
MFRRTFQAAVGLLLSASFVTAQTQNPAPAPAAAESGAQEAMEDLQVGDHWTYEVRDDVSGDIKSTLTNTVTDVSASQINIRLGKLGTGNTGYQTYDRSWNLMDNGAWHNRPNDGTGIQLPLAVGKSWSFRSTDLNNTAGSSWKRSGTSKVVAQESITTAAGTFDTYKIETSFQVQNTKDPTRKIQTMLQTRYAPSVDHWVKRSSVSRDATRVVDKSTVELVEYGRR